MILYRWQGDARNFGDELNTLLWPDLLPGFFDDDPSAQFLGIGSVLDGRHPPDRLKLVAGSGYGGYEPPPMLDETWRILWVRGPHTARRIGLPAALGLGDPAALLPCVRPIAAQPGVTIGFMPHFESAGHGAWHAVAALAGLRLIDPRDDPAAIVQAIAGCRVLVSEALHGVIVADAVRVPWVAIRPLAGIHRAKWQDWAETMGVRLAFRPLPASTLLEQAQVSALTRWHAGRTLISRHAERLREVGTRRFLARAAAALAAAARQSPQLSADAALARCQDRMLSCLDGLTRGGVPPRPQHAAEPACLHRAAESA
ncbi:MAG: polysaccharide pyruvyl transferase family protein [Rhodospirillales bacterium]|nr:polysaccharide pyruvyl transferase family protein [Rhodospirillales bacterium]